MGSYCSSRHSKVIKRQVEKDELMRRVEELKSAMVNM